MDDWRFPLRRRAVGLAVVCLWLVAPRHAAASDTAPMTPEFSLHGFSDASLRLARVAPDSGSTLRDAGFAVGQFDLFMTSRLSDEISFLGELVVESNPAGETVVDLERVFVKTSWSEAFQVTAGRTHTELGWWNTAYHHGALLQPMVERPQALRFEDDGGILPVHSVGVVLSGQAELARSWQASWLAGISNGRGRNADEVQTSSDENLHKATTLHLWAEHQGEAEVRFGASGYLDHIPAAPEEPGRDGEIRESIGGAFVHARSAAGELIAEGFLVKHDDQVSGATFRHRSGYVVVVAGTERLKPYAAWDRLDAADGDPYFTGVIDRTAVIGGLRFDVHPFHSIRLEYRNESYPGGKSDGFSLQSAFSF